MPEVAYPTGPAGHLSLPNGTEGIALQRVTQSTVAAIDPRLQSNAAAIVFDDFIVAVDAGMRPYAARLFRETLERTYRRPVRFVCVTHKHADHTFGLSPFKDVTLFGSRQVAASLEHSPEFTPEAIAAGRSPGETRLPPGGAAVEQPWFVQKTLERWHAYYRGRP